MEKTVDLVLVSDCITEAEALCQTFEDAGLSTAMALGPVSAAQTIRLARPRHTASAQRGPSNVGAAKEIGAGSFVMAHVSYACSPRRASLHRVAHRHTFTVSILCR